MQVLGLLLEKLSAEGKQLQSLIAEFNDIFALDKLELGCTNLVEHTIETSEHPPIRQQPYHTRMASEIE